MCRACRLLLLRWLRWLLPCRRGLLLGTLLWLLLWRPALLLPLTRRRPLLLLRLLLDEGWVQDGAA